MKTAFLAISLAASTASAEPTIRLAPTCVTIDALGDELPEAERPTARLLLVRALEQLDLLIVETGCEETIELSHQRAGGDVIVRVRSPRATRELTVGVRDDMMETYARMAKTLLEPEEEAATSTARMPASYESLDDGVVARRVRYWHARLGLATHEDTGSAFALGVRHGSGGRVMDLSLAKTNMGSLSTIAVRGQLLSYLSPRERHTAYAGGGLSIGSTSTDEMGETSGGFAFEGTVGIEWNRGSSVCYSFEAGLSLPLYTAGDSYPAAFVTTFGIGM